MKMNSRVNPASVVEVIGTANRDDTGADVDRLAGAELAGAGVATNKNKTEMIYTNLSSV